MSMHHKNNMIDPKSLYAQLHPDEMQKKKKWVYNKGVIFENVKKN